MVQSSGSTSPAWGDIEATKDDLKGQLLGEDGEPLFGGVVTLNSDIGSAALAVVRETGADIKIATFDENREVLEAIKEGRNPLLG